MNRFVFCIVSVALLLVSVSTASARKWTDDTGKFSIEAELVEVSEGTARLRNQEGKFFTVQLSRLSKADRDYLAALHKEAVAAIKKLEGIVKEEGTPPKLEVDLSDSKVTDVDLACLKDLTNLKKLNLGVTEVTDPGLEHLKGLTNLTELTLFRTHISGTGFLHLKGTH